MVGNTLNAGFRVEIIFNDFSIRVNGAFDSALIVVFCLGGGAAQRVNNRFKVMRMIGVIQVGERDGGTGGVGNGDKITYAVIRIGY